MHQQRVQPLRPPRALLDDRLAESGDVAQPLNLGRRNPGLRQHRASQQHRQPARIQPIGLRSTPPALQGARLPGSASRTSSPRAASSRPAPTTATRWWPPRQPRPAPPASRPTELQRLAPVASNRDSSTAPVTGYHGHGLEDVFLWISIPTHSIPTSRLVDASIIHTTPDDASLHDIHLTGRDRHRGRVVSGRGQKVPNCRRGGARSCPSSCPAAPRTRGGASGSA